MRKTVQSYTHCPMCGCTSLAVLTNGRLVRHSVGLGSVEKRKWLKSHGFRTTICRGSGMKVMEKGKGLGME